MDLKSLRQTAREKLQGYCRVCQICDGRNCIGGVPGLGGAGSGTSFKNNYGALAAFRLNLRTIHNAKNPETSLTLFNNKLATPILGAPITGNNYNMGGGLSEREWVEAIVQGCLEAGTLACTGDGADPEMYNSGIAELSRRNGLGIPFIKPRKQEEVRKYLRRAEDVGKIAVGMDVDGAGLITMALKGQPVGPKSKQELHEIICESKLPFVIKGIMTVEEAEMAVEVGAAALVVSNHGGRVLDHTPGTAEVLAEIAASVKGKIKVLVDGGIRSGVDVLKMLALGADAVLLGRPLVVAAYGGGALGVSYLLNSLTSELQQAMILTGCATLDDINMEVLI